MESLSKVALTNSRLQLPFLNWFLENIHSSLKFKFAKKMLTKWRAKPTRMRVSKVSARLPITLTLTQTLTISIALTLTLENRENLRNLLLQKPTHRQRVLAPNSIPNPTLTLTLPHNPGNFCRTDKSRCLWVDFCPSLLQVPVKKTPTMKETLKGQSRDIVPLMRLPTQIHW